MLGRMVGVPSSFLIGQVRIPFFGVFATVGLVAALLVGERTAGKAGVDRDKLWDAGIVAVVVAFVASRVLLVVAHFAVFRAVPLLVLSLPSLTYGGMLATVVVMLGYLWWKRVPVLGAMDAWAPCAAVLAAFLELGHFFEGTGAGMPTSLPWGVVTPGDTVMGRVQPVQLYGVAAALGLGWVLWRRLGIAQRGVVAALGLMMGGVASFALDMLRQPLDSQSSLPLESSQFVALGAMVVGVVLWAWTGKTNAADAASAVKRGEEQWQRQEL